MRRLLPFALLVLIAGCSREPEAAPSGMAKGAPLGELSSPEELAKRADVPYYPGADAPESKSNIKRDGAEARYEIVLLTKDKPDKVMAFYKEKLPKGYMIETRYMVPTPKRNLASISAAPEGELTRITLIVRATEKP